MRLSLIAATLFAGTCLGTAAQADTVAALIGDATLAHVDTAAKKVTKTVTITGIGGASSASTFDRPMGCSTR